MRDLDLGSIKEWLANSAIPEIIKQKMTEKYL